MTKKAHHIKKEDHVEKPVSEETITKIEGQLIDEGLDAIYGKGKTDFSKLDRANNRITNILLTVVITLAVIAAAAWGAFFVYTQYFSSGEEDAFDLEIIIDDEIVSGTATSIEIVYANPTLIPIANLDLEVRLPTAFQVNSLSPVPGNNDELKWDIGFLPASSDGIITIEGVWIADIPSSSPIQVFANFRPSNFNADFQDIATAHVSTIQSTLELKFTGPEEATPGESLDYTIALENKGEVGLENIEVQLELPDGFYLNDSDPKIEAGAATIWTIDSIAAGEITELTLKGSFAADTEGFEYFDIEAGLVIDGHFLPQDSSQGFTDVLGTDLSLQLVAAGSTEDIAVEMGQDLRVTISYQNTGEEIIDDLELLLDFQAEERMPISWTSAELDGGLVTSDGIYWDSEIIGEVLAGERKILNLILPIESSVDASEADQIAISIIATTKSSEVRSSPIVISINSEADFYSSVLYYNSQGAPLGGGPLPPTVGETTTYRVYWSIENSLHNLDNVMISAVLPPQISWVDQTAANLGTIDYDSESKTVSWNITTLPSTVAEVQANFAISITPDEDDVGKFAKLISGASFSAKDTVTGSLLQSTTDSLTTDLLNDEFAKDLGAVID
ncbi:MAG: hypothetical protein Q8P30_02440 [Candidatus Uhrbacteria bacterium]|nr:hypothetical protein [Candidatus Uhrbacteria bacterium]